MDLEEIVDYSPADSRSPSSASNSAASNRRTITTSPVLLPSLQSAASVAGLWVSSELTNSVSRSTNSSRPTGRLLLTDRETVLMSTLRDGDGAMETAIWGRGPQNSLVVVLKTIFAWWLEPSEQESIEE